MIPIVAKRQLSASVFEFHFLAPAIARKRKAGQFVMLRVREQGERFPLTIVGSDPQAGTVRLIIQVAGRSTTELSRLNVGDSIIDLVGPLGHPTPLDPAGTSVCVGGGIGVACIYPIAEASKAAGSRLISIIGARTAELLLMEDDLQKLSDSFYVTTDDGSKGEKGFVSDVLKRLLETDKSIKIVYAVGPARMMQVTANTTRPFGVRTIVSLNPIMVDATGMCGGCRISLNGEIKFACVDGPDFDAHGVDFEELIQRQATYREQEAISLHQCQLDRQ